MEHRPSESPPAEPAPVMEPMATVVPSAPATPIPSTNGHDPARRISRADAREMRRREREEGVPFVLEITGFTARVRDLPFSDRVMLEGIPVAMRPTINAALETSDAVASGRQAATIDLMLQAVTGNDTLTDAVCIAGFIWPRLVQTEAELDGTDDVWLVDDLHIAERRAYQTWIGRDREVEKELARVGSFHGARLAEAGTG